ncbi:1-phosphatidylinositol 4,5-bisphosphate phosphodiesterase delta-4-like [Mobula birostris]|uniref:1-phosphatidylinositol 4,5-bisphosphate phosphodiesterase delta-4-like n=1 Tax=Mobula birostris TaxID=1983395 RepID=UPI003B28670D
MGPWLNGKKLHVMVISAQQLPSSNTVKRSSAVDRLVRVQVFGVEQDSAQEVMPHLSNDGLNPKWNTTFLFNLSVPELAFDCFLVQDYSAFSRNEFAGQFTLPFTSSQQGYTEKQE